MATSQQRGNFIDSIGTFLRLPEWNLSEKIAGGPTTNTSISNPIRYTQLPTTSEPTPTPRVTNPTYSNTPRPTPTPQPQQSSGGDGFSMDAYRGWDETAARADWNAKGRPNMSATSSGNNLNNEIDAIYNPLNQAYSNYQAELEKQRPIAIEEANNATIAAQNELDRSLGQYAQNRDTAQQSLQDQYSSAYSSAIREYNNLKQGAMSRFGGGSSTGQAVGELLGQQTLRGTADLRKTMMQGITQAFQYFENANKFVNDKKFELKQAMATEAKKINSIYDQKRADVEAQKFANESAKQAARVDVLRQQMADAQALSNQKNAAELELSMWHSQLKATLQANLAKNSESVLSVPLLNDVQFSGLDGSKTSLSTSQVPTQTSYDIKSPVLSDSELQGNTFNDLFNVFA